MVAQNTQYVVYQQLTSARVVSTANISGSYINGPLNNGVGATLVANSAAALTIDGVTLSQNDRVLLVGQTNANENGIYVVQASGSVSSLWVLIRSSDFQNIEQMKAGQFLSINAGTANAGAMYVLVEPLPAQLGIDDISFESTQAPGSGDVTFDDVTVEGILTVPNTGLHVSDTDASHDLIIKPGSNLTADRTFTITTSDADRTLNLSAANVTVSAFGATLVDDASKFVAHGTLGIKSGTTLAYGGGGTSNAFVATGLVSTDIVVATILASTNAVSIAKAVPTADTLTITFSADPGAGTTVQWHAIATV